MIDVESGRKGCEIVVGGKFLEVGLDIGVMDMKMSMWILEVGFWFLSGKGCIHVSFAPKSIHCDHLPPLLELVPSNHPFSISSPFFFIIHLFLTLCSHLLVQTKLGVCF